MPFFFQLPSARFFLISSPYLHVVVTSVLQSTPLSLPPLSAPLPALSPGYLSHSHPFSVDCVTHHSFRFADSTRNVLIEFGRETDNVMSRHHPYGPQYDNFGPRRGGTPSGPGPDRYHRFDGPPRGRGFGRGRGRGSFGGASQDFASSPPIYDQAPSQGNMGGYSNYNSGPNQDSFYQNSGFANQFSDSDAPGGYDQSYGNGNFQGALSC